MGNEASFRIVLGRGEDRRVNGGNKHEAAMILARKTVEIKNNNLGNWCREAATGKFIKLMNEDGSCELSCGLHKYVTFIL